ncbi:MAG TPA: hypothetical protein VD994_00060 [Prosthecobacter sp.]|nr:hypothetical protein [Prosthecobacter sp.]
MKHHIFLVLTVLSVCGAAVLAQAPVTKEAEAKIAAITAQFQTAYDQAVGAPHAQSLLDLDAKYLGAVNRALTAATQAGNLDDALKLREETARVTAKGPLPPVDLESLPASLKQLRATYRGALEKLESDRVAKAQPYYDHYEKLLGALQTELTKQGLIDDALVVKSKRERVALDRPKIAAVPTEPPPDASSAPKTTPTVSPSAVAQKGSPWRTAAEWAISLKAEVQIEEDSRRRNCREAKQLPAGKFAIIGIRFVGGEEHDGMKMNEADLAHLRVPEFKRVQRHRTRIGGHRRRTEAARHVARRVSGHG